MNYHPFIMIVDDNFSEDDISEISSISYHQSLFDTNKFLIMLISYWELFVQGRNLSELTPFGFNGSYLMFKRQYNDQFDSYEDQQLLETEIVLWMNNCLEQQKQFVIKKIDRNFVSNVDPFQKVVKLQNALDNFKQKPYCLQKTFLDAINYYNQLKKIQHQIFIGPQEILSYQYYIYQFKVQKMFLQRALDITNNQVIFNEDNQKQLSEILQKILQQPTQLKEPILKNFKISWTQKEIALYKQDLIQQEIYEVTEEQIQQLNDLLVNLRSIQLTEDLNFHDFTVVYYKYNFIIKCLLHFERLIYFDDYDLHFDRVFKQLNITKLKIDWVELILKSNEIILY